MTSSYGPDLLGNDHSKDGNGANGSPLGKRPRGEFLEKRGFEDHQHQQKRWRRSTPECRVVDWMKSRPRGWEHVETFRLDLCSSLVNLRRLSGPVVALDIQAVLSLDLLHHGRRCCVGQIAAVAA